MYHLCTPPCVPRVGIECTSNLNPTAEFEEWGEVEYDLCFGGVFYALVDADQVGLTIVPEKARELAMMGVELRRRIAEVEPALHPLEPALNGLSYVMFRSEEADGAVALGEVGRLLTEGRVRVRVEWISSSGSAH